jgi:hypothetical protein
VARQRTISNAQRMASLAVLAALCALAAWLLAARTQPNPAVVVALSAPAPHAGEAAAKAPAEAATAAEPGATAQKGATGGLAGMLPDALPGPGGPRALAAAESFSPATLSDKIDGKAELYLAAGFAAMACRGYSAGNARIDVYLYRMKSPDAAFAAFSGQRRPGAAQSPLAKNAYLTDNALFLTSGRDYLEVIADRAGAKTALEALAKAVLSGLAPEGAAGGAKPPDVQVQDLFPRPGIKADSIRLAVADAFGCQGLTNMFTAEYAAGPTAFLARRKDAAEAASQAGLYRTFLTDNGYAVQAAPGSPAGAVVLVMEGSVEILFTRGRVLAGVHDAPDLSAALKLAVALDDSLKARGAEK